MAYRQHNSAYIYYAVSALEYSFTIFLTTLFLYILYILDDLCVVVILMLNVLAISIFISFISFWMNEVDVILKKIIQEIRNIYVRRNFIFWTELEY